MGFVNIPERNLRSKVGVFSITDVRRLRLNHLLTIWRNLPRLFSLFGLLRVREWRTYLDLGYPARGNIDLSYWSL